MVVYTCPLEGNGSSFVVTVNNHYHHATGDVTTHGVKVCCFHKRTLY